MVLVTDTAKGLLDEPSLLAEPALSRLLPGGMYYVISNGCLQLLPKLFPYSSSCSVGSNHSVDSFAEIVALSNYPVIARGLDLFNLE